jgi:hypothetical protein
MGFRRESWERAVAYVERVLRAKKISVTRGRGHYPWLIASDGPRRVEIECHGEEGRGPRHLGARLTPRDGLYAIWVHLGERGRPVYSDILPATEAIKRLDKRRTWCPVGEDIGFRNRWDILGFPSLGAEPR